MNRLSLVLFLALFCVSLSAQQTLDSKVDSLSNLLSVGDKVQQLINDGFMTTPSNYNAGIPGFVMNDGPHGNRFDVSVSFPVGISVASTFDRGVAFRVGKAMGEEFWGWGKDVQLGPCIDLCRDPRNGRSGETGGEDPFLSGEIGTEVIKGIQKSPVIATIKHYNCQNKEDYRHSLNAIVSERNLMEHYGLNFKKAVQDGGNLALMSAYNLINGDKSAESYVALTTILRDRWGFPFFVMSDWGGIYNAEKAIEAGNDVCMGSDNYKTDLLNLFNSGAVTEATITKSAKNVIRTKLISGMMDSNRPVGTNEIVGNADHLAVCKEAGQKAMILLKNKDNILPLSKTVISKILLVGPSANKAQLDGFGSAWVNATYTVSPKQGIEAKVGVSKVDYTYGCTINGTETTDFINAKTKAATADVVIFVGGLDDTMEGEGYGAGGDRKNGTVTLPTIQHQLINELAKVNPNIIVVINSGGICAVNPFINNIKGLVYAFYPGQEGGTALADVLFGDYNPAGRLPVTMPKNDAQIQPVNDDFNDDYLCGYRYNDQINQTPEFVFGFGLSYTTFAYSNIVTSGTSPIVVSVDIKNTGTIAGEDVPQLYLTDDAATVWMPKKQLKGFERVMILPGETKTVTFELLAEDFQYWNSTTHKYTIEAGTFTAKVGPSSDNLPLSVSLNPSAMIGMADLVVTNVISNPRYPAVGDKVTFYAMVVNKGDAATSAGVVNNIEVLIDGTTVSGSTSESIAAGGMKMVTLATNPWSAVIGTFTPVATVDKPNLITESIEVNNGYSFDYKVVLNTDNPADNLCLNKPVIVSSTEGTYIGKNAVDGKSGTRWASLTNDGESLIVDLQAAYDLTKVKIFWEGAYASSYNIDVAKDEVDYLANKWTTVAAITGSTGGTKTHDVVATGRYLRLACITRGTAWGNSLYEFQAFGTLADPNKLTINKSQLTLRLGASEKLTASQTGVLWESYIPSIATVDATGVVKGVKIGLTQIIARSADGVQIAACNLAVVDSASLIDPVSSCEITSYTLPAQMEAECYQAMSGIQLEPCSDEGGGKDVGYFEPSDWVEYSVIAPEALEYTFNFRNAALTADAVYSIWVDGVNKKQIAFTHTGGYQIFVTTSTTLTLTKGPHVIRFVAAGGGCNLNWIEVTNFPTSDTSLPTGQKQSGLLDVFPNPCNDFLNIATKGLAIDEYTILDYSGRIMAKEMISSNHESIISVCMATFASGAYLIMFRTNSEVICERFVKH